MKNVTRSDVASPLFNSKLVNKKAKATNVANKPYKELERLALIKEVHK